MNLQHIHHKVQVGHRPLVDPEEGGLKELPNLIGVLRLNILLLELGGQQGLPVEARGAHVDHPAPGDGGRGGVVHILRLKDELDLG